jgi:hypothetical protein
VESWERWKKKVEELMDVESALPLPGLHQRALQLHLQCWLKRHGVRWHLMGKDGKNGLSLKLMRSEMIWVEVGEPEASWLRIPDDGKLVRFVRTAAGGRY